MGIRARFASTGRGRFLRRGLLLLLGGVVALPYLALAWMFTVLFTDSPAPTATVLLLLAVALVIGVAPAFLTATRSLEIVAARLLLDIALPDPPPGVGLPLESRLRAALWFALHAAIGAVLLAGLVLAVPFALAAITLQFDLAPQVLSGLPVPWLWQTLAGAALLAGVGVAASGLGNLAALMAPVLLGPSRAEEIEQLRAQARQLAERNRLARDLHDSMGHALTVAVVQAGAAREVMDADPEFARRALAAIENSGREAMDHLDHALSLIRGAPPDEGRRQPTLAQMNELVANAERAGLRVEFSVQGSLELLPQRVSQEGYRIVQEGLTNAARHASPRTVRMVVAASPGWLSLQIGSPVRHRPGTTGGGRGLVGMRERVALLGGEMTAGMADEQWRVAVRLPVEEGKGE